MVIIPHLTIEDVREIFERVRNNRPSPPHLPFQVVNVPVPANGARFLPPPSEFQGITFSQKLFLKTTISLTALLVRWHLRSIRQAKLSLESLRGRETSPSICTLPMDYTWAKANSAHGLSTAVVLSKGCHHRIRPFQARRYLDHA